MLGLRSDRRPLRVGTPGTHYFCDVLIVQVTFLSKPLKLPGAES